MARYEPPTHAPSIMQPVSIIICAKNEAENLKKNLPHILNQNYPFFEVIVVNDNSSDETEKIILEFKKKISDLVPR
ncbi:MAG: glycosyltransferase [Saprospiraceae bacterium]|nr:glycosyltransferase [Saprospiraceae bacterium]